MSFLGKNPFHTLLLLTERPGKWPAWLVIPVPVLLAVAAGRIWATAAGGAAWGWATGGLLVALALADWGLLAALPRGGFSFGPVQPPFLVLSLARWLLALFAAWLVGAQPAIPWALLAAVQGAIWGLAAYGTLVEPFRLQVSTVEVAIARLANPGTPLRIVQLSDLHVERLTRRERALPGLLARLAPDLVVLTGDFLNTTYNQDAQAVADLQNLLAQIRAPLGVYGIWGTREVDVPAVLRPALDAAGVVVLEDEAREVRLDGQRLWLMGLTCTRDLAVDGARLARLVAEAPEGTTSLLLYHTPDLMPRAVELGVDLYLAGHTHGGQWRVPGFGALLTSSHYGKRYEAGYYRQGGTHLYVSRGIGLEGFGTPRARFFCPPEVVVVDLGRREVT